MTDYKTFTNRQYTLNVVCDGFYYNAFLYEGRILLSRATCPSYESAIAWASGFLGFEF